MLAADMNMTTNCRRLAGITNGNLGEFTISTDFLLITSLVSALLTRRDNATIVVKHDAT
jgi:hypothetical protein